MLNRNIIEDLLLEVSVYHPIINFQEKEQVETLIWICEQKGYSNLIPVIKENLLLEAGAGEEAKKKGLVHLGRGYYGKEKGSAATHKTEDGKLIAIQAAPAPTTPTITPSTDDIEAELPPALKPSTTQSPVQRKNSGEEEKPEDKAKGEHETAVEDPEKVLNDPQASMRSKAVARSQQSKNSATQADAPSKDSDAKGEFKPNPELKPKTDEEGNVAGTKIPAEVSENPNPEFVGKIATKMDEFGEKVVAEEERAQQTVIDQMKKEGKLPQDFKAVGGREMGFGFKHPALKDNPELQKELADRIKKENKPPHWNLCQVSIPGTNKFCDENLGIPRENMPQLGGKPKPGSQGEAKAKRIADQNVRKKMGLGIDTPIPPSRQSEYDELYSKENISHVNVEQEFEDYLKSEGIAVSPPVEVPASSLKATQSELVGEQVVGMVDSLEEDPNNPFITAPIMVTKDGYVIDGHHRWAAIQAYNMKHCPPNGPKPCISMKVRIVDEDIMTHIPRANDFANRMGIETMSGKAKGGDEKPKQTDLPGGKFNPPTDPPPTNEKGVEKDGKVAGSEIKTEPTLDDVPKNQLDAKVTEMDKLYDDFKQDKKAAEEKARQKFGYSEQDVKGLTGDKKKEFEKEVKANQAPTYNLCKVSIPGTNLFCSGNKGIPREKMPQFKGEPREGTQAWEVLQKEREKNPDAKEADGEPYFRQMLADRGIKVTDAEVPSENLKATQSELVGDKVLGMKQAIEDASNPNNKDGSPKTPEQKAKDERTLKNLTGAIYVSRDGYVVDGHHRWAAITAYNMEHPDNPIPLKTMIIDQDIDDAIQTSNEFAEEFGVAAKSGQEAGPGTKTKPEEKGDNFSKATPLSVKPKKEPNPKFKADKPGVVGKSETGANVYHLGGGYYSDTKNGPPKYIAVNELLEKIFETDDPKLWSLLFEAGMNITLSNGETRTLEKLPKDQVDAALIQSKHAAKKFVEKDKDSDSESEEETLPDKIVLDKQQEDIKQNLNTGDFTELKKSAIKLNKQRDLGVAGAGGPVASYGEARLTSLANEINDEGGYDGHVEKNRKNIDKLKKGIYKNKNSKEYKNKIEGIAKQLGYTLPDDEDKVVEYIAARELYAAKELKRLQKDPNSLWYKKGKQGFGENQEAFKQWAYAQFDGALTTTTLVREQSNIDTTKPFTVIQSNPKEGGHDAPILSHLEQKLEEAKQSGNQDDIKHYEKEIKAFRKLGFHDTMVVGQDKNGRTTVLHITNKKQNDLQDIWGNTTPEHALNIIKASFPNQDEKITQKVVKVIEEGIEKVTTLKAETTKLFGEMKMDANFIKICSTPEMKKYISALGKNKALLAWMEKNNLSFTKKGGVKQLLKYAQQFVRENPDNASFKTFGKIIHKVGEYAQNGPFIKKYGEKIKFNTTSIQTAISNKNNERDTIAKVHSEVADSIVEADKELGFPDKDGNNGPHTQSYLKTIMHSMHFDAMVENYDGNLAAVTGIRGTTPADFRECLAKLSGFKADPKKSKEENRKDLNNHLLNRCRLNPTTYAIEIQNENGTETLAEDTWRNAGDSQKVEKKLGDGLRKCVASKADNRAKSRNQQSVKETKQIKPPKKSVKEMIQSLPPHIKERIAHRLKERNDEMNSKVEKLKELVRQRIRK